MKLLIPQLRQINEHRSETWILRSKEKKDWNNKHGKIMYNRCQSADIHKVLSSTNPLENETSDDQK